MARKKHFSKIHIPKFFLFYERESEMRELVLPLGRLLQILVLVVIVSGFIVFGSAQYLSGIYYQEKIKTITADNEDLSSILIDMRSKVENLSTQIEILENKDRVLRLYADLPEIDQDIRKMGIGGRVQKDVDINNITDADEEDINNILSDLSKLSQDVKLELYSYEELYETIQGQSGRIEATPSIAPIDRGWVSSSFGYRMDPFTKKRKMHHGLDISAATGTPIYSTASGRVVYAKFYGSYGYTIKLDHGYGYITIYAHMSKMDVRKGDIVKRGDVIGKVGNTGRSTGPHIHYEVRYQNKPLNPVEFIWTDDKL